MRNTLRHFGLAAAVTASVLLAPTSPAYAEPPAPTIDGTPTFGNVLTAQTPAEIWDGGAPTTYSWKVGGNPVDSAQSWTITPESVGQQVTVTVEGTSAGDDPTPVSLTSEPVTIQGATLSAGTPTIGGTPTYGKSLAVTPGAWTAGTTLAYQWRRYTPDYSSFVVVGTNSWSYRIGAGDVGHIMRVVVTGSKPGYSNRSAVSRGTARVAGAQMTAGQTAISANPRVGRASTIYTGTWTTGATLSYQWYVSGRAVTGATTRNFVPRPADVGKYLQARVVGRKSGFTTIAKFTPKTALVARGYLSGPIPKVSGTPRYGQTLTAIVGTWAAGVSLKYQWLVGGAVVKTGSTSLYLGSYGFHGKRAAFRVTAYKPGYDVRVITSSQTAAIYAPKPAPSCMPGYSPCLPVRADMDCAEIGHPVTVTGDDPYRLDADGDGVGCETA